MMKKLALILAGILVAGNIAMAQSIGIGYGVTNEIYKSDENDYILPLLNLEYDNFFLTSATESSIRIGYNVYKDDFYTLALYVKPFGGYEIDSSDMKSGYKSIDDRDHQVMGGIGFRAYTGFYEIELGGALEYGKEGGSASIGLSRPYVITPKLMLIPSVNFTYYDSDYVDYYFGVDSGEARRNPKIGRIYNGDSACAYGVNLSAVYEFTDSISVLGSMGVNKLSNEISDSPIVENDIIYYVGTGIVYTF